MSISIQTENRITTVSINRPHARNAVDPETATALFTAMLAFEGDENADVAVLTGDKTAFCAGFDLKTAAAGLNKSWLDRHAIPDDWVDPAQHPLPSPMGPARLMLSKPVIAAIEGPAVAGGMELAVWCDIRISAQSAYFGIFCRRWGVPLIDGGSFRLPEIVGTGRANDLILTGRPVHVDEALSIGLATQTCADGAALETALSYAHELLCYPQGCMRADRTSSQLAPLTLAGNLRREWKSAAIIMEDSIKGAARFTSGKGRGGDFENI
ncbi:MAG: enoyl-CoA hydratase [Paracoccaceae bacterium]|jgi:enoyl-CoA hydratase